MIALDKSEAQERHLGKPADSASEAQKRKEKIKTNQIKTKQEKGHLPDLDFSGGEAVLEKSDGRLRKKAKCKLENKT